MDYEVFFILILLYLDNATKLYGQSVIDEEYLYTESCRGSTNADFKETVKNNIDFIMKELHQQNHENMLLKQEVEELKRKNQDQRIILSQMTDTVRTLVQKVKLASKSCACPVTPVPMSVSVSPTLNDDIASEVSPNPQSSSTTSINDSNTRDSFEPTLQDIEETSGDEHVITQSNGTSESTEDNPQTSSGNQGEYVTPAILTSVTEAQWTTIKHSYTTRTRHYAKDCQELLASRDIFDGKYRIQPINSSSSFHAHCQLVNKTAWTVIQRRDGGQVDFYRNWKDYKDGFGDPLGEFWIGNEKLYQLTNQGSYKLRIDMWDWSTNYYFAESNYFYIGSEEEFYRLYSPDDYYAYSGFGGSGLRLHRGSFMTYDRKDPLLISDNCADQFHTGWWFTTCVRNANLNGKYYQSGYEDVKKRSRNTQDIYWHNIPQSLKKVEMKLLRTNNDPPSIKV